MPAQATQWCRLALWPKDSTQPSVLPRRGLHPSFNKQTAVVDLCRLQTVWLAGDYVVS